MLTVLQRRGRLAKRALAGRGMLEAVTYSLRRARGCPAVRRRRSGSGPRQPHRRRPLRHAPEPRAGLLRAAQRNADRGFPDTALFEVGQCFASDEPEGQSLRATGLRRGTARHAGSGRHWSGAAETVDAFEAKADALALLAALGVPTAGFRSWPAGPIGCIPAARARCNSGPKNVVGHFGELHPRLLKAMDLKGNPGGLRDHPRFPAAAAPPADQGEARPGAARPSGDLPRLSPSSSPATWPPPTS